MLVVGCNNSAENNDNSGTGSKFVTLADNQAAIYFQAQDGVKSTANNYDGYSLFVWNNEQCASYAGELPSWDKGLPVTGVDEELGAYWVVELNADQSQCVNFIPRDSSNNKPLGEFDAKLDLKQVHAQGKYVFTKEGIAAVFPEHIPALPENTARIYLNMEDKDIDDLTLHVWNDAQCDSFAGADTAWDAGLPLTGNSETYGAYWDVAVKAGSKPCINIIPHRGDEKPLIENAQFDLSAAQPIGMVAFSFEGSSTVHYTPMAAMPNAVMKGATAHWLDRNLLAMPAGASSVELLYSQKAAIAFDDRTNTFTGVDKTVSAKPSQEQGWKSRFPQLSQLESWALDFDTAKVDPKLLLKGQLIAVAYDAAGKPIEITQVQPAEVLDAIYTGQQGGALSQSYGAILSGEQVNFALWAPTAQAVELVKYDASKQETARYPMVADQVSGAWSLSSSDFAFGDYYRYRVTVYHPVSQKIETYEVTDPYSLSLSMNSEFSQVVDLNNEALKPADWDAVTRPVAQANPAKFVIYEAHVRDFSAVDVSTLPENRGKFTAFTQAESVPVNHLKELGDSGVTHLHLLPIFDIATINEDPAKVANIDEPFSKLCKVNPAVQESSFSGYCNSGKTISDVFAELKKDESSVKPMVQELNQLVAQTDSFNWGYDPFHYTVPEGSYASNAEGYQRIIELRQAIMAIKNNIGMNVVMDVVYNHTNSAGPVARTSVLDKIVPWYYQRLNPITGGVENSTCCSNTAPERAMFEKLISDSLVVWSRDYKIDAFRFDLMGHHPLDQMQRSLDAVKAVDPGTYFYGEGWNFGEVANDAMFVQATQPHLGGTGIGSFSDRLRDAVRGGGPFDGGDGLRRTQGFGNGAYVQPNEMDGVTKETALHLADLTRLGMAGNLKDYTFVDAKGRTITGAELDYNGAPAGYAVDPTEIQNYVSKHDNQTLWDNNQYKIDYSVTSADRVRMQAVSLATAMLGQGVPFTHMGSELLRSKSMQRDSYDSGDWYNVVDFSMADNNWNKGLPRKDKDGDNYAIIEKVIASAGSFAQPSSKDIATMAEYYKELAALRQHYPLITLGSGKEVNKRVAFHNTGKDQIPGLIVMSIDNGTATGLDVDPAVDGIVVVINASPTAQSVSWPTPVIRSARHVTDLAESAVYADGKITVPAWTPVVFELPRGDQRGAGIRAAQ
ncbi:pullulanase-type alpha-1,6-glucosidase [Photobacterium aquae]|nr:pullulanase-type alpha-1,6-glucosidase [Photobacterium aquae]